MSAFERAARSRKVLALLAVVPTVETARENQVVVEFLAGLSAADRAVFAGLAKVNAPSEETWRELVAAVSARTSLKEVA